MSPTEGTSPHPKHHGNRVAAGITLKRQFPISSSQRKISNNGDYINLAPAYQVATAFATEGITTADTSRVGVGGIRDVQRLHGVRVEYRAPIAVAQISDPFVGGLLRRSRACVFILVHTVTIRTKGTALG
jgi:hypothetical protein